MQFIDNNVTGENAWVLTRDEPMPEGQLTMTMITKVIQNLCICLIPPQFLAGGRIDELKQARKRI